MASASLLAREAVSASLQLVAVRLPTAGDTADYLPRALRSLQVNEQFFLEVWASRGTQQIVPTGLAAVYANVLFDPAMLSIEEVIPSDTFQTLAGGVVDKAGGIVRTTGGCAAPGASGLGVQSTWVRVTTLRVRAESPGTLDVAIVPASEPYGVSVVGEFGSIDSSRVEYGGTSLSVTKNRKPTRTLRRGNP